MKGAIPTDMPSLGIPWLMACLTPLYRKAAAANRIPVVANVAISSVPGSLDYGLVSAYQSMPNLRRFERHLQASHEELMKITEKK